MEERRKRLIATVAGIVAVIVIILAGTVAYKIIAKSNKTENGKSTEQNLSSDLTLLEKETTSDSEESSSSEEESESVEEIAVEELERIIEEEISSENEEAWELPSRVMTNANVPYDGASRNISCWGDSMIYGVGGSNGGDMPSVLGKLTGISTYNFGIPSATSDEIAACQGGLSVVTDRDIEISGTESPEIGFVMEDTGEEFSFSRFIYYISEEFYLDDNLLNIKDDGGFHIYKSYQLSLNENFTDNNMSAISLMSQTTVTGRAAKKFIVNNQTKQETSPDKASTDNGSSDSGVNAVAKPANGNGATETKPSETPANGSESTTKEPGQTTAPTQPSINYESYNIPAGTRVYTRASIDHKNDILILEIGSNGGWESDYQQLIEQYDNMLLSSGCQYYIIIGDTDDPGTSVGDDNQQNYDYSNIGRGDTGWEAALREAYGDHFINMRAYLIENGLQDAGLTATTEDVENYKKGCISKQLRSDWTHLNDDGYHAKAVGVYKKGVELGYWS